MGAVTLDNVVKRFGFRADSAVVHADLQIEAGEFFTLLGPSGCGKTTTLRMVAGFYTPTSGRIYFDRRDVTNLAPNKRGTGMVFQNYALFPHMSVGQNVAYGLRVRRVRGAERRERVAAALALVGLGGFERRRVEQLSGGQQQRVALARALVIRPAVLLLDEPLSNLDAKLREETRAEIRRIQREAGITTLYVTHDQAEALALSDRIAVMSEGKVEQVGTPREVYQRPASATVASFVGQTNLLSLPVVGARDGRPIVRLGTAELELAQELAAIAAGGVASGPEGEITISLRPEAFSLCGTDEPDAIRAQVKDAEFTGISTQLAVTALDTTLHVLVPGHAVAAVPGEILGLRADINQAWVVR